MKSTRQHLFMTGFKAFSDIKTNPSSDIGKVLFTEMLEEDKFSLDFEELEVSVEAVSNYFDNLEAVIAARQGQEPSGKILLAHIGVHSGETKGLMRVEVRGYNEINASIPDVRGVTLDHIIINESLPPDSYLESDLVSNDDRLKELESLIKQMNDSTAVNSTTEEGCQRPRWIISEDAGRYLCNYALYRALQIQNKYKGQVYSLFIHVLDPSKGDDEDMKKLNPCLKEQTFQVRSLITSILSMLEKVPPLE